MTAEQRSIAALEIRNKGRWRLDEVSSRMGLSNSVTVILSRRKLISALPCWTKLASFDRAKRFWTSDDFREAPEVRTRIIGFVNKHIETGGAAGTFYRQLLEDLGAEPVRR
jgi:hypothetical protein